MQENNGKQTPGMHVKLCRNCLTLCNYADYACEEKPEEWHSGGVMMCHVDPCGACKPLDVAIRMASFSSLACIGSGSSTLDTKCRIPFKVARSQASARELMASLSRRSSSISCAGLIGGSGASLFLFLGRLPEAKKVTGSAW